MPTLELDNINKSFGPVVAVEDLSFCVDRGEIVSLLGPSGCGKTTTLRLIAGFEDPDAGCIRINGADMSNKRPYERNVGLLFQNYALFPHMTVYDNISFGLPYRGWSKDNIRSRVTEMLALVKLAGTETRFPAQLSGGQQQRVALARALATEPEVVLLDEPLSALDAKLRHELRIELKEILRTVGSTTIIVTHDQEEAMGMAERVIVLNHGRIQQEAAPEAVYTSPSNRFVAEFVGRSNWFSGTCAIRGQDFWTIECGDGLSVVVPAQTTVSVDRFDVGIRPEKLEIVPADDTGGKDRSCLPGTIVDLAVLGSERQVLVRLGNGQHMLAIDKHRSSGLQAGQCVSLCIYAADCIVLPSEQ
jgi:putative spermidine/putrescine transport system ATP-binding protein/putrescine transport system ATP-binding protein